ncbi:LysR substrate-binding domain-containing protein [Rhodococcus indonesiensis]|uniref:LysR substrate-binding domain-containing protein n=1 Tax=Rhodococcus indonesiensis TaxID=3055869 RepID=UPI0039F7102D
MNTRHVDMRSLELLSGIEECGSVAAAGRRLDMTPTNAWRHVRQLERSIGTSLVRRDPTGSTLTTQGRTVVESAREVLDALAEFFAVAEGLRHDRHPALDVCASTTIAEQLMPRWLSLYRRKFHDIETRLQVRNSRQVLEQMHHGSCQLGFVECPDVPMHLHSVVIARDQLVVVVHPHHPWAHRDVPITAAELAATPMLVREAGSGTRMTIDRALGEHRVSPLLELGSTGAIRSSALAGMGPAVMSSLAVANDLVSGALQPVPVRDLKLERDLRAVWRADRPVPLAARNFLTLIKQFGRGAISHG